MSGAERREAGRGTKPAQPKQKARRFRRAFISIRRTLSGGFVRHRSVVAIAFDIGLVGFTVGLSRFRLGAAARALGELAFDFLDRFGLRRMLDDGDFARQAIE